LDYRHAMPNLVDIVGNRWVRMGLIFSHQNTSNIYLVLLTKSSGNVMVQIICNQIHSLRDCGFKMFNQEMLEAWSVTLLPPHAFSCAANHAKVRPAKCFPDYKFGLAIPTFGF